ncbi:putative plant non-specific lipid-transfer protein/Par allergen [Helianthus debilis subsp. tardiflorus]
MVRISTLWSVAVGLLLVSWRPTVFAAPPTCSRVGRILAPCTGFLNGQEPTSLCCSSVKKLHDSGKNRNDRVAICNCIKQVTKSIPYDSKRIPLMSKKCGVKPEFPPIDKNYNCAT